MFEDKINILSYFPAKWRLLFICQSSPLGTAKRYFKKALITQKLAKEESKMALVRKGLMASVKMTNSTSSFIDADGSQSFICVSSY